MLTFKSLTTNLIVKKYFDIKGLENERVNQALSECLPLMGQTNKLNYWIERVFKITSLHHKTILEQCFIDPQTMTEYPFIIKFFTVVVFKNVLLYCCCGASNYRVIELKAWAFYRLLRKSLSFTKHFMKLLLQMFIYSNKVFTNWKIQHTFEFFCLFMMEALMVKVCLQISNLAHE